MNNLSIEPPIAVVETGDSYSPAKIAPRTTMAATDPASVTEQGCDSGRNRWGDELAAS